LGLFIIGIEAAERTGSVLLNSTNVSTKPTIHDRFDTAILLSYLAIVNPCGMKRVDESIADPRHSGAKRSDP
jgi:hypothetical protein